MVEMGKDLLRPKGDDMGRISGAVHGYVLSRDYESQEFLELKQRR